MKAADVIVVGGGSAGVMAALASARTGARTILVEKSSFLGGTNTLSLVGPLVPFLGKDRQRIVGGIPHEVIETLRVNKDSFGHISDPIGFSSSLTPVNFTALKLELARQAAKQDHLDVLFETSFLSASEKDGYLTSIQVLYRDGTEDCLKAKVFIDATGDALLTSSVSDEVELGREADHKCQPMSMIFSLGNVDLERVRDDVQHNPKDFVLSENLASGERMGYVAVSGYFNAVSASSDFPIARDRLLFFQGLNSNEVFMNTTRLLNYNSLSSDDFSKATQEAIRQVHDLHDWLKREIDAFKKSTIREIGKLGIRESRRIIGRKRLETTDIMHGLKQQHPIAIGSYPIDIHSPDGSSMNEETNRVYNDYEIDVAMTQLKSIHNLMVAGRIISATHEASASSRVSATCMAVGQSVGIIAAVTALDERLPDVAKVDYSRFRKISDRFGAIVSLEQRVPLK